MLTGLIDGSVYWESLDTAFFSGSYEVFSPCRWYKDGMLLKDTNKYQTFSEPRSGIIVLVVKNPSNEDMGHYECEVSSERFRDLLT